MGPGVRKTAPYWLQKTALECRDKWQSLKGYYSKLLRTGGKGSSTWSHFSVLEAFDLLAREGSTKRLKSQSNIDLNA